MSVHLIPAKDLQASDVITKVGSACFSGIIVEYVDVTMTVNVLLPGDGIMCLPRGEIVEITRTTMEEDPTPWRHVDGARVSDPHADGAPQGGYTFDPRAEYGNHADRFGA